MRAKIFMKGHIITKILCHAMLYSGTPLVPTVGDQDFIEGWPYLRGLFYVLNFGTGRWPL